MFERPRLATYLPVTALALVFLVIAAVALVSFLAGWANWMVVVGPFVVVVLGVFFLKVPVGQRWYWGGTGCRDCGDFEMLR